MNTTMCTTTCIEETFLKDFQVPEILKTCIISTKEKMINNNYDAHQKQARS